MKTKKKTRRTKKKSVVATEDMCLHIYDLLGKLQYDMDQTVSRITARLDAQREFTNQILRIIQPPEGTTVPTAWHFGKRLDEIQRSLNELHGAGPRHIVISRGGLITVEADKPE